MNLAPFKITLISIVITLFIIVVGSIPAVQNSLANLGDKINGLTTSVDLTSVEKINKAGNDTEEVKVNRIVDGDTIVLEDGRTLRFLNMDTPETKKPGVSVMCYGPEASKYTTSLLQDRNILIKSDKEDKDRYGRILRFIYFVGADTSSIENSLNAKLVKEGYARSSIYKPNNTYQTYFEKTETIAKQSKVGAWGSCPKQFVE